MEFRQIETFVTLAEILHFGQTAEKLRIAQPHVSRRIKQLEDELQVQLFYRDKRNVSLTEAGEVFLGEARTLLRDAALAKEHVRESALGRRGKLNVSLISSAMLGVLREILGEFHQRHPNVHLSFRELGSVVQLDALTNGTSDIAFFHPPARTTGAFGKIELEREPLIAILPTSHRLAGRKKIDLFELSQDPWVMFPRAESAPIHDLIISTCQKAGFSPKIVQEAGPIHSRLGLVAAGFGVHIEHRTWRSIPFPGIAYVPIRPGATIGLSCCWRKDDPNPVLGQFIAVVERYRL